MSDRRERIRHNSEHMKRPSVFRRIGKSYGAWQADRRVVRTVSDEALNKSKRAIFALHRGSAGEAEALLADAEKLFRKLEKPFKSVPTLVHEGAYKAALEEFAEARLFAQFHETGAFGEIDVRGLDASIYLGGLCDATGEVVRYAVRQATAGKFEDVARAYVLVEMTVEFLLELDLTGYLRNKFDQAKRNQRSLEQIMYELSLKK